MDDLCLPSGATERLPLQVHFLMNDKCNARCVMCGGDYFRSTSGRRITLDKFRRMAANLRLERTGSIVLSGAGDPLLNPDLLPIVRHVRETYPKVNVMLTTNGIALTRELSGALLRLGIGHVNVSINAAARETYRRIMQVDRFDEVCRNTADFADLRKRSPSASGLQLSCAVHRRNIEELPSLVELGKAIGVDSINVLYCRFYPDGVRNPNVVEEANRLTAGDSLYYHQELSDRVIGAAKSLAAGCGIMLTHEPLFRENAPGRRCIWHESEIMVGFDGEIYPCGGAEVHFREKVEKGVYRFGNALTESIDSFWNGETYRALRLSSRGAGGGRIPECACCANLMRPNDLRSHVMRWKDPGPAGDPLVSVIVPTHNRPDLLPGCLKSILDQTFPRFEVIVVNDAGPEVETIVTGLNTRGNLTYVRHSGNRGLAAARNTGIRLARGRYIAYLDDDDRYHPDHLRTLVDAMEDGTYKVAYTDAYRVRQSRVDGQYVEVGRDVQYSFDFDADRILVENFIPVLCFLHEKSCIDASGPFDESLRVLEDWDLWIRMSRSYAFRHVPKVTCEFTWREDGTTMTSARSLAFGETTEKIYGKYAGFAQTSRVLDAQARVRKMYLANRAIAHAVDLHRAGDTDGAVRELARLVEVDPRNAPAHKELGVLYYYGGDSGKALEHLRKSLAIDGNMAARKDLARLYVKLGRADDAVDACEGILRETPNDIECLSALAKISCDLGLKGNARALFARIGEIKGANGGTAAPGGNGAAEAPGGAECRVSIVVPVFNKVDFTKDCIAAISSSTADVPHELIVVDNGSTDGTAAFLASLGGNAVVIANGANLGFAEACNRGAKRARGDYLVFLNNDTVPQPGWLANLVRGCEEEGADICGARLLYPHGTVQHAGIAFNDEGDAYHMFRTFPADHPAVNRKRWLQSVTAACMLVRRDLFLALGGFDEAYRNGYEDVDFCLRAKERGYRTLYVPESVVTHYEEVSEGRKRHDKENVERFLSRWGDKVDRDLARWYEAEGYEKVASPAGDVIFVHRSARADRGKGSEGSRGDASVLADMADCKARTGETEEAERLYREALREDPDDGRAMAGLGIMALLRGAVADAGRWFEKALARNARDASALCGLGMARRMEGDSAAAFDLFRRALEAEPLSLPALHELVTTACETGRLEEAEERLAGYLLHRPADVGILFTLAGLRYMAGKRETALDALDRLAAFAPAYDGAAELRERITAGGPGPSAS